MGEDREWDFDDWAESYDAAVAEGGPYYERYGEVLEAVARRAGCATGAAVLDIGTGTGNLALCCLAHGASVTGLDPSERMLAKAREKVPQGADARLLACEQPFLRIPLPDASCDAVVSTCAFHHIPSEDKPAAMREMLRVLRPGGRWVLGDLVFEDAEAESRALQEHDWLEEEHFTRIDELRAVVAPLGIELNARRFTPVTWVLWATKPGATAEAGAEAGPGHINVSWLDQRTPRLYDWYDECPYDLESWRAMCTDAGGPVLDIACGTGRVAIELARSGLTVCGVDLSPAMIARAREKLAEEAFEVRERVSLHVGDATTFDLDTRFPTAIMPCFSFHEIGTLAGQRACLERVSRHLQPGGLLAVVTADPWYDSPALAPPPEPSDWGKPKEEGLNPHTGLYTRMWALSWAQPDKQVSYYRLYFEESDDGGHVLRRFSIPPPPEWNVDRAVTRSEMQHLLQDAGFRVEALYEAYTLRPCSEDTRAVTFVARKVREGPVD